MLLNIHYMHLLTIWKPQNHKASFDAKRLNNLESSVIVAIFCKTTRIAYIWYKIRLSYILVRMVERSNWFLLQDPDGHWFEPWWGLLFFPFLNCIRVFYMQIFRSNVWIYQYRAFNDMLQYMPKSSGQSL